MAKRGILRTFFGSLINIREWINFDEISSHSKIIIKSFKDIFRTKASNESFLRETFEEFAERLNLTDAALKKTARNFLYYSILYLAFSIALIIYALYLFSLGRLLAVFATASLACLLLAYAYREHFWYMQIKRRKLHCVFKDWLFFVIGRKNTKNEK